MIVWGVGTTNKAKLESVRTAVERCFPDAKHEVLSTQTASSVSAQPMSAEEAQRGCIYRARQALRMLPECHFGVGIEGGVERIEGRWFECGWMAVIERESDRMGIGSSARFEMSAVLMQPILESGLELSDVVDNLTGETDVRSNLGAMGVLTAGHLGRAQAYEHGIIFALAPFLSSTKFWSGV